MKIAVLSSALYSGKRLLFALNYMGEKRHYFQSHSFAIVIIYFFVSVCRGRDSVEQSTELITATEGDAAVLNCKYSTVDQSPYLFWYKQQSKASPQFVLMNLTFGQGHTELEFKDRFSATLYSNSSLVPLKIQNLHVPTLLCFTVLWRPLW